MMSLEAGTYEIIRNRLQGRSKSERSSGSIECWKKSHFQYRQFALIANQRITTEHNG